ncbi:MAG: sulfatase-like hydrolase/transferase, partial [Planctomycetota bacterium]
MAKRKKSTGRANRRRSPAPKPTLQQQPRRRRRLIGVAAIVVVGLGIASVLVVRSGNGRSLPAAIGLARGSAAGFNVVLLTLDTLRADHLGCYGFSAADTPAIDALAAGGVRFADAVTAVPMTLPAHATILTGDYPIKHGVRDNGTYRLAAQAETLAERLQAEGYATAAFIGAFVLERRYGLSQGFEVYDDQITLRHRTPGVRRADPQRPGNVVVDSAIRWLEEHQQSSPDQPFLAWVHLFDPHTPYDPPEPFRTRFASNPYDGEVAFTDRQVGRFVDKLGELELRDETLVVLVGDHGEGLGDHGESTHSLLIYESTMRVPLMFYGPGAIPGGRVVDDRVVAIVDIKPTVLDLLGLDPGDCDGVSLLQSSADADRAVYMETLAPKLNHGWSELYGLRTHGAKYIKAPTPEYYDLGTDPGERLNLWAERGSEAGQLENRLVRLLNSYPAARDAGRSMVALDPEAIDKLAALGYVRGGAVPTAGPPRDPKQMIALAESKLADASALVDRGRHEEAIPLVKELLAMTPSDAKLWSLLSYAQAQASLIDEAIASRRRSIELQPNDPNSWLHLGRMQYGTEDVAAASTSLAQAELLEPDHGEIFLVRARHALRAREYEQAIALCQEARKRDPTRHTATSWSLEARVYQEMGRPAEAEAAYERAFQAERLEPDHGEIFLVRARHALRAREYEQAIAFCQEARKRDPTRHTATS